MEPAETAAAIGESEKPTTRGPAIQENWLQARLGPSSAQEAPIYTDATVLGAITEGLGPYQFFNTVPMNDHFYAARPAVVFRRADYQTWKEPKWNQTNDEGYHGGSIDDEAAALLSICLGIRAQAADVSRDFGASGDPRGFPVSHGVRHVPTLPPIGRRQIIPSAGGEHSLDALTLFKTIPNLSPDAAVALVRAARLYQAALWISEVDPNQAWILLASAVEAAAEMWDQQAHSPVESLTNWNPSLVKLLHKHGNDELTQKVAEKISKITGSTSKFVSFLLTYRPPAPDVRPPVWCQLDWQERSFSLAYV